MKRYAILLLLLLVAATQVVEDDRVRIEAPYSIDGSQWVNFEILPKSYTGDVNIIFGYDSGQINPQAAYYVRDVTHTEYFTCLDEFRYTLEPKVATCYYVEDRNGTDVEIITFETPFDRGDIPTRTVERDYIVKQKFSLAQHFKPFPLAFTYDNKDRWFYVEDVPVEAGVPLRFGAFFDVPIVSSAKYDLAFYPSLYGASFAGVASAYEDGNLYLLDPFINATHYEVGTLVNVSNDWNQDNNETATTANVSGEGLTFTLGINASITPRFRQFYTLDNDYNDTLLFINGLNDGASIDSSYGRIGGSVYLNGGGGAGARGHVHLGNMTQYDWAGNPFTVDGWFYKNHTNASQGVWVDGDAYTEASYAVALYFGGANNVLTYARRRDPAGSSTLTYSDIALNKWTYFAAVYDGANLRLYVADEDDSSISEVNSTADAADARNPIGNSEGCIGIMECDSTGEGGNFGGHIDDVSVLFNDSLSLTEIQRRFNAGLGRSYDTVDPYDPTKDVFVSDYLSIGINASYYVLDWDADIWVNVTVNATCNADDAVPVWSLVSAGVTEACGSAGDMFAYRITLDGTADYSPLVYNLTGYFLLTKPTYFTIDVRDLEDGYELNSSSAALRLTGSGDSYVWYHTSNGTIVTNITNGNASLFDVFVNTSEDKYGYGYLNELFAGYDVSNNLTANLSAIHPRFIVVANENGTNNSIASFSVFMNGSATYYESTTNGTAVTDAWDDEGLFNITVSSSGYYNRTYSNFNVSVNLSAVLFEVPANATGTTTATADPARTEFLMWAFMLVLFSLVGVAAYRSRSVILATIAFFGALFVMWNASGAVLTELVPYSAFLLVPAVLVVLGLFAVVVFQE